MGYMAVVLQLKWLLLLPWEESMDRIKGLVFLLLVSIAVPTYASYHSTTLYIDSVVQVVDRETHLNAILPYNMTKIRDPKLKPNAEKQFHRHAWRYKKAFCTDEVRHLLVYGHMETIKPMHAMQKRSYSNMRGYYIKCDKVGLAMSKPHR
jgi:hypothetical protein